MAEEHSCTRTNKHLNLTEKGTPDCGFYQFNKNYPKHPCRHGFIGQYICRRKCLTGVADSD